MTGAEEEAETLPGENTVDVLGIGFGPANIALAIALAEERPGVNALFLEANPGPGWQSEMLLRGADTQNHASRDLATLRNPKSRFTFLNYLFEHDRLLDFLNLPLHFPLRRDYAQYVQWVAGNFQHSVRYSQAVISLRPSLSPDPHWVAETSSGETYRARCIVLASGRNAYIPPVFGLHVGRTVFHTSEYSTRIRPILASDSPQRIAVVGSSQSAVEVLLDLHSRAHPDAKIHAVMQSFGPRLKDTSPFSEEAFLPAFTDRYYNASPAAKREFDASLRPTNYSSADGDVIDELYTILYEDKLENRSRVVLHNLSAVSDIRETGRCLDIKISGRHTEEFERLTVDAIVLATGYKDLGSGDRRDEVPPLLQGIKADFATNSNGDLMVERDYELVSKEGAKAPPLFLNGLCESSHGLGDAGSFSLLSLRAMTLIHGMTRTNVIATPSAKASTR